MKRVADAYHAQVSGMQDGSGNSKAEGIFGGCAGCVLYTQCVMLVQWHFGNVAVVMVRESGGRAGSPSQGEM